MGQRGEQRTARCGRVVAAAGLGGEQQREVEVAVELAVALGDEPVDARLVALGFGDALGALGCCRGIVGAVALPDRDHARDECDDEEQRDADEEAAEALTRADFPICARVRFGDLVTGEVAAGIEELAFVVVEIGVVVRDRTRASRSVDCRGEAPTGRDR